MPLMIMDAYTSPSPEGLFCERKKSPGSPGQSHEMNTFLYVDIFLTGIYEAAQLRGLFRFAG